MLCAACPAVSIACVHVQGPGQYVSLPFTRVRDRKGSADPMAPRVNLTTRKDWCALLLSSPHMSAMYACHGMPPTLEDSEGESKAITICNYLATCVLAIEIPEICKAHARHVETLDRTDKVEHRSVLSSVLTLLGKRRYRLFEVGTLCQGGFQLGYFQSDVC